jgi:Family of unknown function (DUF6459)
MQQIPPPQLPWHSPEIPARPTVIPTLPTRVQQPGRQAPLPDAVAVWQCEVPDSAPPFDAEPMSTEPMPPEPMPPEPETSEPETPESAAPDHDSRGQLPAGQAGQAGGWPSQFAQVLAETLAGSRPARQLTPWTTEEARKRIRQLGPMLATDQRPRVRRIMTSVPAAGVLEMTAVVGFGPRVRVLALRLERDQPRDYRQGGSRWCCTAIESA